MALKVLSKQLQRVFEELPQQPGFSAGPLEDDLLHWEASIVGPIWFLTKVFHPNVDTDGKICIDFLKEEWKPSFSISHMLLAICSLLMHPNAENPIVQEIADLYLKDREKFNEKARQMTLEHAKPDF